MPDDTEALKKELAEAKLEIQRLKLSLSNLTVLLKSEMRESGKLPKLELNKDAQD